MRVQLKTFEEFILACFSASECEMLIHYFNVVIKMKKIGIDMRRITPATFDKFYKKQRKIA